MIIDEVLIDKVVELSKDKLIDDSLKEKLKQSFPGVRFTLCSEDDVHSGKPVLEKEGFSIYLVGSSDHCLTLTNDFSLATGVVIAECYED